MKSTHKLLVSTFTLLALVASAYGQSPREQLQQLVEQLQKTPSDNALRERIIKIALTLKPLPALPDTAVAFEGRAQFAFRSAKSENDFLVAAQEYEKALAAAPWVPGYYSDLCTIYEKASKYVEAKRHCGFYLTGLTDPAQVTDVKRRIAGLEFGIEKVAGDKRRAAEEANSPKAIEAALLSKVEGARFVDRHSRQTSGFPGTVDEIFDIKDRTLQITIRIYSIEPPSTQYGHGQPGEFLVDRIPYRDGAFTQTYDGFTTVYRIRSDGVLLRKRDSSDKFYEIPRN